MTDKKFLQNFGWLNLSSLVNKFISFFYVIALVRLLPQSSFGLYNLVWAHLGIFGGWQDLGTTPYGLLQNDKNNYKILNNLFTLRVVLALVISILTILSAWWLRYSTEILKTVIIFSGLYLYTASTGFLLIICSVQKKLQYPAFLAIGFNTGLVLANLSVLFLTKNVFTVFKVTAGFYFAYGLLIFWVIKKYFFNFTLTLNIKTVKTIVKNSLTFSLIGFFASIQTRADSIIINKLLGPAQLALYSAAHKFYDVPLLMVANYNFSSIPILKKLYQTDNKNYRRKIINDLRLLLFIAAVIVLATWSIGAWVIRFFFSNKYQNSIGILKIIIFNLPLVLGTSVFINALYAQNKQAKIARIFAVVAVLNVILNLVLIPILGISGSAITTVISYSCLLIGFGSYLLITLRYENHKR